MFSLLASPSFVVGSRIQDRVSACYVVLRRSGLRVRPLLRQAFQPQQQQQNQARGYASRQQAQQRQAAVKTHETGKQQPSHASESQGQECGVQISEPDSGATSQPQATFRKQAQSGPQAPQMDRASVIDGAQPIEPTAQAQQGTGTQPKVGEASTKSQTSKKTKKDYAAWAGATAETRAIARAHLKGNPDMADNIQPMLAGVKGELLLSDSLILYCEFASADIGGHMHVSKLALQCVLQGFDTVPLSHCCSYQLCAMTCRSDLCARKLPAKDA